LVNNNNPLISIVKTNNLNLNPNFSYKNNLDLILTQRKLLKPILLRFQAKIAETFEPCLNLGLLPKSHDSKARPLKLQLAKNQPYLGFKPKLPKRLSLVRILAYCRKATIQKLGP
jgi:hypothetical protein